MTWRALRTRFPRAIAAIRVQRGPSRVFPSSHVRFQRTRRLDPLYPTDYIRDMFTVRQTEAFVAWLDALKDKRAQIRIAARLRQAEAGSLGDWQPIEGEVSEMRIHYGPGYRLYFVRRGRVIVVLLNAGKSPLRSAISAAR
jgi:putative addiction module killer protein